MTEALYPRLREIFEVVFELPADVDPREVRPGETSAWDSLGHVTLVTAIASEFGVTINPVDSLEITSFDAAAALLEELLESE
jgi:acyl carrier protein